MHDLKFTFFHMEEKMKKIMLITISILCLLVFGCSKNKAEVKAYETAMQEYSIFLKILIDNPETFVSKLDKLEAHIDNVQYCSKALESLTLSEKEQNKVQEAYENMDAVSAVFEKVMAIQSYLVEYDAAYENAEINLNNNIWGGADTYSFFQMVGSMGKCDTLREQLKKEYENDHSYWASSQLAKYNEIMSE